MDQLKRKVRKSENNQTPSHLQLAQVRDACPHLFKVHLHEVVLHTASLSGGENFLPVQRALSHSDNLSRVRIPALQVHGDEAARILHEVLYGVVSVGGGLYRELELHHLGIE